MSENNIGEIEIGVMAVEFSNERIKVKEGKIFSSKDRKFDTVIPVYPGNERPAKVAAKTDKKKTTVATKNKTAKKEQKDNESR